MSKNSKKPKKETAAIEFDNDQQKLLNDIDALINDETPEEIEKVEEIKEEYPEYINNDRLSELPKATLSNDIYADITKGDEKEHTEKTSRRAKYEGKKRFVGMENPFQSVRDGEENPIIEDYKEIVDDSDESENDVEVKKLKTFDEISKDLRKRIFPQKTDAKREKLRKIVADISALVLVGCVIAFVALNIQSKQQEKKQMGLSSQISDVTSTDQEDQLWAEFRAKYPDVKIPDGMMAKYAYLYAVNQDLVGWISIPNSGIDVQIVQAADNKEYLKKDFYGKYSRYGCPFLDYRNDSRDFSQNTIIYGHHMSDGLVFAELSKYKELNGFLESPVIKLDSLYETRYYKIYAAFITNSKAEDDNDYIFNYTVTEFPDTQNFEDYIKALDERKLYTTGVDINSGDKILTLSTCTYEFSDARLVIVARQLRMGETTDIDTSYAVANGNPRYPQAWYDKRGIANPFASASRWVPESATEGSEENSTTDTNANNFQNQSVN